MKFKIVYDNDKNRLRVRAGRAAFTTEEGYGIAQLLTEKRALKLLKIHQQMAVYMLNTQEAKNEYLNI